MAGNVVRIAIQANSDSLTQAFGEGGTAADRLKGKMQLLAKAAVAALAFKAAQAVQDFVADSRRAFSELHESLNAVEVLYGSNADAIKAMGRQAAESFGLSNSEFNSFAVAMFNFADQIAGPGGDIVGVVEEMSTRVADFASIMDLDVNVAFEKFQSGLAGQSRPLREFGIDVSDARVKVFALENGIGEVGREMTQGEKVVARYGLIMQQTDRMAGDFQNTIEDLENATRVTNSQLENSKAVLGEALLPVWKQTNTVQRAAVGIITEIAAEIGMLTGELTEGAAAVAEYEAKTSDYVDTADDAIEVSARYGVRLAEVVEAAELSTDELEKLRDMDEEVLLGMGHTSEEIEHLSDVLNSQLAPRLTDAEEAARDFFNAQQDLGDATGDTTDEIKTQADTLRAQTDPLFAAMQAAQKLEDAQRELNDAISEYGEDSDEARDAARDVASANSDLIGILEDLKADGIDPTGQAARRMLEGMGIPPGVIDSLFREFDRIESNFESRVLNLSVAVPNLNTQFSDSGLRWEKAGTNRFQHGGIVTDPTLGMIGEAGSDEGVIPLNSQGAKFMAATMMEALRMMNGGGIGGGGINITVNALDPQSAGEAVVRALEDWRRSNGDLPFSA